MSLSDAPTTASLAERLPWLDRAATMLLTTSNPALHERVAACALLAGATGRRAIEALVAALDDNAAAVRIQAVTSLASSSLGDHALRFAHAVLHRRTDVRRAALHAAVLSPTLLGALLGDPLLSEEAAAVLVRRAGQQPAALAALVVTRRQGLVDDGHVVEALLALPWSACAPFLRALPGAVPLAAPGAVPLAARLAAMGDDHFVDVVAVIADNSTLIERLTTGVADAARCHVLDVADLERIALAITVIAAMRGTIDPALVAIAAVGDLDVLASEMIAPATRRAACAQLLRLGSPRHDDVFARLQATAPWTVDDDVDLAVLAGLQRVCRERPVAQLTAIVTRHELASAFVVMPTPALLSLPPTNSDDRVAAANFTSSIAHALCARAGNRDVDMSVLSELAAVAADPLPILDRLRLEPNGHARLLLAMLAHDAVAADNDQRPEEIVVSERRLERVIEVVVRTLDEPALATIVRHAAPALKRGADRARVVVAAVTRVCPLPVVAAIVEGLDASCRDAVIDVVCAALTPTALSGAIVTGDNDTGVMAILQRRAAGVVEDLDALELESVRHASAASLGAVSLALVTGRRRRGLCAALRTRTISDNDHLAAALLASHDPPAVVAALLAPLSSLRAASTLSLLSAMPAATLPLLGLCSRDDDDALGQLATEIAQTPGGFRGVITLALHLQAPLDVVVLEALTRFARATTGAPEAAQGSVFDPRLYAELQRHLDVEPAGERATVLQALASCGSAHRPAPPAPPVVVVIKPPWSTLLIEDDGGYADAVTAISDDDKGQLITTGLLTGLASPRLLQLLRALPSSLREPLVRRALHEHHDVAALDTIVRELPLSSSSAQVQRLREVAHRGARQATALVGRPIGVTWIGSALGFTRLGSSQIHINPLPVLLDERDGATIVAGLIAHELGHHRYHGDVDGQRIWAQAQREQLGQVLNLVADEHLERNLRVLSPQRYGRPLQVLAAWAFQHRRKAFALTTLLTSLGARALTVLSAQRLGVARSAGAVVVDVGDALTTLEQQGSAFSRFMRALRMGKGDRFDDPLVARGLALFAGPGFRTSSMATLLEIARALRQIFGDELQLLQTFDFHTVTNATDGERIAGGLGADDLDSASVDARTGHRSHDESPAASSINLEATTTFAPISHVERVAFDLRAQQALVASVRRPVETLRRVLLTLGEGTTTRGRQLRGHRVDRASLVDVVTRGDPRLLVARHRRRSADLFIGIAVDCSGSMRGAGLDRARHFAAVIAGAARDLDTVDARFIGFSDDTLYDAGDARRCAVAALRAHRGNNDAAALSHLAGLARRSARQIKLLVMISDGAPTECSVDALRSLVLQLGRRGMICAQVAVAPLDEVCFPHHVLVDDDDLSAAARRFGAVVERLVGSGTSEQRATSSTTTYTDAPPATTGTTAMTTTATKEDR